MHIQPKSVGINQISNICQFALRAELEQPGQPLAEGGSKLADGMRQKPPIAASELIGANPY